MFIQGHNTRLIINGQPVAGETRCSLSVKMRTHRYADVSNPDWASLMSDISSWTAQAEGLLTSATARTLMLHWLLKDNVQMTMHIDDKTFSGEAYITDLSMSGKMAKAATWSLTLTGTGQLSV